MPLEVDRQQEFQPPDQECRDLVNRILNSSEFKRATRQREFLLYVLDRKLAGCPHEVTEPIIGHVVYGRRADYNSGDDSIVRTEARTLRKRLERYFDGEGSQEPVVLDIPRGGYLPVFRKREPVAAPIPPPSVAPNGETLTRRQWFGIGGTAVVASAAAGFLIIRNRNTVDDANASPKTPGLVQLDSSDGHLNMAFQLAKQRALSCVYSGDPVGEWYATRPDGQSNVFCMRDVCHQSTGAAVLGLNRHTLNMLRRFAQSVARNRNWCGYWIMTKDGIPDSRVYASDQDFGYCLPAGFDLLRTCHRQLLWSGEAAYLGPEFFNFYERTAIDFPIAWDPERTGTMQNLGRSRIHASYFQRHPPFRTGADLISAQYAAYLSYASLQESIGREGSLSKRLAKDFYGKAADLRTRFNAEWWNSEENRFHAGILPDGRFQAEPLPECHMYTLLFGIAENGAKSASTLDYLAANRPNFAGAFSYMPDAFFLHGRNDIAFDLLMEIAAPGFFGKDVGEVGFSILGTVATGLMGVSPDSPGSTVQTLPRLPEALTWARLSRLPVLRNEIALEHRGTGLTTLTNQSGPVLRWKVTFLKTAGKNQVVIDGARVDHVFEESATGQVLVSAEVPVRPGQSRTAVHS